METHEVLRMSAIVGGGYVGAALAGINPVVGVIYCAASVCVNKIADKIFRECMSLSLQRNAPFRDFFFHSANLISLSLSFFACTALGATLTLGNLIVLSISMLAARALFDVVAALCARGRQLNSVDVA